MSSISFRVGGSTFKIMGQAKTFAVSFVISAPASLYSLSSKAAFSPAPDSMSMRCPLLVSAETASGVRQIRFS